MKMILAVAALALTAPALAAQPAYRDDRSTPEAVVQSFYNAVGRKEYARAYSYFEAGQGVGPYAKFAAGYKETISVKVLTGKVAGEGAAGSTYYTLPVSLDATSSGGGHAYFSGCYTLRLIQPAIQEPPVVPMHIVSAKLRKATGAGASFLPTNCQS